MTTPTSGQISLSQIANNVGYKTATAVPHSMSEFYLDGTYVGPDTRSNVGGGAGTLLPSSGQVSFSQWYGAPYHSAFQGRSNVGGGNYTYDSSMLVYSGSTSAPRGLGWLDSTGGSTFFITDTFDTWKDSGRMPASAPSGITLSVYVYANQLYGDGVNTNVYIRLYHNGSQVAQKSNQTHNGTNVIWPNGGSGGTGMYIHQGDATYWGCTNTQLWQIADLSSTGYGPAIRGDGRPSSGTAYFYFDYIGMAVTW